MKVNNKKDEIKVDEEVVKEISDILEKLTSKEDYNDQIITETDKQLGLTKYGSVSHVTKMMSSTVLKNYKSRISAIIDAFKEVKNKDQVKSIQDYMDKVIKDSEANLKANTQAMERVEIYTNDYIKYETMVKTYKDLLALYKDVVTLLNNIMTKLEEPTKDIDGPVKETSKKTANAEKEKK